MIELRLDEPTAAEVLQTASWTAGVLARALESALPDETWLLVSPLALPRARLLRARLVQGALPVVRRVRVRAWSRVATALHLTRFDGPGLRRAVLFERAWMSLCPADEAEAWAFPASEHARLGALKPSLREGLPNVQVSFGLRPGDVGSLHAVHAADLHDAGAQARKLDAALAILSASAP